MSLFLAAIQMLLMLGALCVHIASGREIGRDVSSKWKKAIEGVQKGDLTVRRAAAESLVEMAIKLHLKGANQEEKRFLRADLKVLRSVIVNKKEDGEVRANTASALGELAGCGLGDSLRELVAALLEILKDETENEDVRGWIAMILPDLGPPEKVGPAIVAASQSRNIVVRVNAFQQLDRVHLDPDDLIPLLRKALTDPVQAIRTAAVTHAAKPAATNKQALQILLRAISDPDKSVRQLALQLLPLSESSAKEAKQELVKLMKSADLPTQVHAAVALMKISGDAEKYASVPLEALRSKEADDRAAAAYALTGSGSEAKELVPGLTRALEDPDERVRVHAAFALCNITAQAEKYLATIVDGLASKEQEVRMWAALYLGLAAGQARPAAQRILLEKAKAKDAFVRGVAISTLVELKGDRAILLKVLSDSLADNDSKVRTIALETVPKGRFS